MDSVLHVDPERSVCVLGPQIAAEHIAFVERSRRTVGSLSYKHIAESGVSQALELEAFDSNEAKMKRQALLANAYELEPAFAANKVVETLKSRGIYEQWLSEVFASTTSLPSRSSPLVERLRSLQEKGALLVYTHYDTVLDRALESPPVLLEDEETVKNWTAHKTSGLLHVHGVHLHPSSLRWHCVDYDCVVASSNGAKVLREACKTRSTIFLGFDGDYFDPLLEKFARAFVSHVHPALYVTASARPLTFPPSLLTLKVAHLSQLDTFLLPVPSQKQQGPSNGREALLGGGVGGGGGGGAVSKPLSTTLLYCDKASCNDAAETVKTISSINISQLTMSHEATHQLALYIDREGLRNLWRFLFTERSQLQAGLLGVSLDNSGITIGFKSPSVPASRGSGEGGDGLVRPSPPSHPPPPTLSLSTNVSVISSMWAPIVSPSVSKLPPSTRPTLPSPLVKGQSAGGQSTPELPPKHLSMLTPRSSQTSLTGHRGVLSSHRGGGRQHPQVRRAQSERTKLSYQDRVTTEMRKINSAKKNGMLVHQESAPDFVYTPEGLITYPSDPRNTNIALPSPKVIAVPQASPLARDGGSLEHRIEYIDQFQQGKVSSSYPGGRGGVGTTKKTAGEEAGGGGGGGRGGRESILRGRAFEDDKEEPKFDEEKNRFIQEAKQWSDRLNTNSIKKVSATLGSFENISSNASPAEQERMLQQHFERVQSSNQLSLGSLANQMQTAGGASAKKSPQPSPTPPPIAEGKRSPSSASSSASSSSSKPAPRLSPLRIPSSNGSPKKSPIHPFLSSAGNVFSYFPPSSTSLQSPAAAAAAANLLCSPSVSQFAVASSLFNPYQMFSHQQHARTPGSVVVTDPSTLQNLQMNLPDRIPCMLPDGSMTFFSINQLRAMSAASSSANSAQGGGGVIAEGVNGSSEGNQEQQRSQQYSPGKNHKRIRSPESDTQDSRFLPLPKRRRSTSLPDISQFGAAATAADSKAMTPHQIGTGGRDADRTEEASRRIKHLPLSSLSDSRSKHKQNMPIPLTRDVSFDLKFGDPMLSFPTPPSHQSSPMIGFSGGSPFPLTTPTAALQALQPMTPVTPEPFSSEDMKDIIEATPTGGLPEGPEGTSLPQFPAGRGPIQLWQFLLDQLISPDKTHLIQWTGNGYEFRIIQPEEIAKLWGARKNKPKMNYDKLSRGLRYYYSKGIMDKVPGKKLTFKYTCDVQHYVQSRMSPVKRTFSVDAAPSSGDGECKVEEVVLDSRVLA